MRGIARLIPDDWVKTINEWPYTKWVFLAAFVLMAPLWIKKGLAGVRERSIASKGRDYEGGTAVFIGWLYVLCGILSCLVAIGIFIRG